MTPEEQADIVAKIAAIVLERGKRVDPGEQHPIVHGARFEVDCECGFRAASNKATPEAALAEIREQHEPRHADTMEVHPVDLSQHPVYQRCHCRACRRITGRH